MTLVEKQRRFSKAIANFMSAVYMFIPEVQFTFGDFMTTEGHMDDSNHYIRLAADLNVSVEGVYITTYEQAPEIWERIGQIWRAQHELARWGGDFESKDLGHFSFAHRGRS